MRTVSQVSELAGVSIRTLHHYDELGLLEPSARSEAGYRLYSHEDLARLQEILVWRQLGFSLASIRALLEEGRDRVSALRRQRELVARELERLGATARALDAALAAQATGTRPKETTMFDGFDPSAYEDEARERWGETAAFGESTARAAGYGEAQWREIRVESAAIVSDFAALLTAGEDAGGAAARGVAERHRRHISRWFYACSPELHRGLGAMYMADERFAGTYERELTGLAGYVREAIAANADAAGVAAPAD